MKTRRRTAFGLVLVLLGLAVSPLLARADSPKISELRVQKVDQTTYFHVRLENPADLRLPPLWDRFNWWNIVRPELTRLPRLVPQDDQTRAVYLRVIFEDWEKRFQPGNPNGVQVPVGQPRVDNLEFVGKVQGNKNAKFVLIYPTDAPPHPTLSPKGRGPEKDAPPLAPKDKGPAKKEGKEQAESALAKLFRQQGSWVEVSLDLDFAKAKKVDVPAGALQRAKGPAMPEADDLEGLWAAGQAAQFALLEAQSPDFGFYGFARETTGRRYKVPALALPGPWQQWSPDIINKRTYEITTGATAITESLALNRLRNANFRDKDPRTVDIAKIQGIDIAEHPWVKMMAGKKPSPEPLAKLVPHDNYYFHFKSIVKFLEAGDLLDQWGTTLSRALEVNSRDYQIKERLEQQLCLKSNKLTRIFGPAVIKSMCLTGNDPYVREGSDLSIIFHLANRPLFLNSVEPYLQEARKNFGTRLRESKDEYGKIAIESFVTPLREVSLHRAFFDDYVVYSNSPVAVRRVIDTYQGKIKPIADSLDFQYMRTVFRLEDPAEDGFLFLSDPFIRNLVGPATRIKERRRLEALTSLSMVTNGALFTAWETGQLPNHHNQLLAATGLKVDELFSPDGNAAFWDNEQKQAVSSFYNTMNFATPLIEIPIDRITPTEQREYEDFRRQYLGLWRQFFDPIGIRLGFDRNEIRWETYILPLVQISQYNDLRRLTGDGTIKLDPGMFSNKTMVQFLAHISPTAQERQEFAKVLTAFSRDIPGLNWMGDWFTIRLDDSPIYGKLVERKIQVELDPRAGRNWEDDVRLFFQIPLTLGVEIRNPLIFAGVLAAGKKALLDALPGAVDWEPMKEPYKDVTIVKIAAKPNGPLGTFIGRQNKEPFTPALYYALVDKAWYLSLREECIKDIIDQAAARKEGKTAKTGPEVEVNSTIYVSPQAAKYTKDFLRLYLEWETHRRALANETLLYPLYRGNVISGADDPTAIQNAALKYLGFIPTSPDFSAYRYEPKTDEITNQRHGSLRRPQFQATGIETTSPLGRLLEQFRTIRADLRFREDGVHTLVTVQRKGS